MAVVPLSHSARDYVRAIDLTCIALWRDGRLGVSRNPPVQRRLGGAPLWRPARSSTCWQFYRPSEKE